MPKLLMRLRFNGATTSRSWILQRRSTRNYNMWRRFNGATTSRSWILRRQEYDELQTGWFQWGHNLTVMDTRHHKGHARIHLLRVSMGPQPHGHGYLETYPRNDGTLGAFQWGHNLTVMDTVVIPIGQKFQWGHNLTVMDTPEEVCSVAIVSMGPQPHGHGYSQNNGKENRLKNTCFNGATTSRSWIQSVLLHIRPGRNCFNGATTSRSWIQHPNARFRKLFPILRRKCFHTPPAFKCRSQLSISFLHI